jgi:hypothetical protein
MTGIGATFEARVRRRRSHNEPSRKATFQIRESLYQAVRELAEEGLVPSASALVEQALERAVRDVRKGQLYAAYAEAANDPVFLRDNADTTAAFEQAVADGLVEGSGNR